jgi:hypothetical protein
MGSLLNLGIDFCKILAQYTHAEKLDSSTEQHNTNGGGPAGHGITPDNFSNNNKQNKSQGKKEQQ